MCYVVWEISIWKRRHSDILLVKIIINRNTKYIHTHTAGIEDNADMLQWSFKLSISDNKRTTILNTTVIEVIGEIFLIVTEQLYVFEHNCYFKASFTMHIIGPILLMIILFIEKQCIV